MTFNRVYSLRILKNDCNIFLHSSSRTPRLTDIWWLNIDSDERSKVDPQTPLLKSEAPKTTLSIRAWIIAPMHIVQGSKVTYKVVFGNL